MLLYPKNRTEVPTPPTSEPDFLKSPFNICSGYGINLRSASSIIASAIEAIESANAPAMGRGVWPKSVSWDRSESHGRNHLPGFSAEGAAGADAGAAVGAAAGAAFEASPRRRTGTCTSDQRHSGSMNGPL